MKNVKYVKHHIDSFLFEPIRRGNYDHHIVHKGEFGQLRFGQLSLNHFY